MGYVGGETVENAAEESKKRTSTALSVGTGAVPQNSQGFKGRNLKTSTCVQMITKEEVQSAQTPIDDGVEKPPSRWGGRH